MISSLSPTNEPKRCRAKVVDHEKFQANQLIRVGINSTYHEFSVLFYKMVLPLHHNHCGVFHLHLLDFLFVYLYYSTRMTASNCSRIDSYPNFIALDFFHFS